jgi:hypothetical protein
VDAGPQSPPDDLTVAVDTETGAPSGGDLLDAGELEALEALIGDAPPASAARAPGGYFGESTSTEARAPEGATHEDIEPVATNDGTRGGSYFGGAGDEAAEPPPAAPVPEPEATQDADGFLAQQAQHLAEQPEPAAVEAPPGDTPPAGAPELAMGAWLGFHDGDTPLMAKLAVHDPGEDVYIFVNRQGVKMREVGGAELAELMSQGLVDILQTASSFRDDVDAARRELDS